MSNPETIKIDEVEYVRKDCIKEQAPKKEGMKYCMIRSYGAGVFMGYVQEEKAEINGVNVLLQEVTRVYQWSGACSLSQLATEGTKDSGNCRFSVKTNDHKVFNVIEIIPISNIAIKTFSEVETWKK